MRLHRALFLGLCVGAAAGCGAVNAVGDAGADPDGGTAVDGGEISPDAQTVGLATVTVHDTTGSLRQGAPVIVHLPDGSERSRSVTDAGGKATVEVHLGDMVTALVDESFQGTSYRVTYVGVAPGDDIRVGDDRPLYPTSFQTGMVNMTTSTHASGAAYRFDVGCGYAGYGGVPVGGLVSAIMYLYDSCVAAGATYRLVTYADDAGQFPIAYKLGSANANNATYTFGASWSTNFDDVAVSFDSGDPGYQSDLGAFVRMPPKQIFTLATPYFGEGQTPEATLRIPPGLGEQLVVGFNSRRYDAGFSTRRGELISIDSPFPAGIDFSLANQLPKIDAIALVAGSDPARPKLVWSVSGGAPVGGDGGFVHTSWYDNNVSHNWIVVVPPDAHEVTLPQLPDVDAAYRPTAATPPYLQMVVFAEVSLIDGYAGMRELAPVYRSRIYNSYDGMTFLPPDQVWQLRYTARAQGD